jgi:hypothetical protein
MWKLIVVAEAPPVIVCVVSKLCLMSITVESFPPTAIAVARATPFIARVKVPALTAVLDTTMLVITAVVDAGTVYKTVPVLVVAAPRNNGFDVFGINKLP